MAETKRIAIYHPPGIAIWDAILQGVFQFVRPDLPWLFATSHEMNRSQIEQFRPDGIIAQCSNPDEVAFFRKLGIPVVNVAREAAEISFPSVQIDDVAVGEMAAYYFIGRGFQKLACVTAGNRDFLVARLEGFRSVSLSNGVAVEVLEVEDLPKEHLFAPPNAGLIRWLAMVSAPTGVFAATDALGLATLTACRLQGIQVPETIAVLAASNNELLCNLEYPALSSVRLPGEKLGFEAARMLHQMLGGKELPREALRLPPIEVVNRLSTDIYCIEDASVREALKFIRENCQTPINVGSVVQALEISRSSLERKFKTLLGRSILDEIVAQRINAAKNLLVTSNKPLYEVAEMSGFGNPRQFAATFRKATGEKPSSFRERMTE